MPGLEPAQVRGGRSGRSTSERESGRGSWEPVCAPPGVRQVLGVPVVRLCCWCFPCSPYPGVGPPAPHGCLAYRRGPGVRPGVCLGQAPAGPLSCCCGPRSRFGGEGLWFRGQSLCLCPLPPEGPGWLLVGTSSMWRLHRAVPHLAGCCSAPGAGMGWGWGASPGPSGMYQGPARGCSLLPLLLVEGQGWFPTEGDAGKAGPSRKLALVGAGKAELVGAGGREPLDSRESVAPSLLALLATCWSGSWPGAFAPSLLAGSGLWAAAVGSWTAPQG